MKFGIFYNEKSGQGAAKKIAILGQEKIKETQNEALLISGAQLAEAVAALEKVLFELDVLIVIGGDGTLSCVLSVMLALDHPLPTGLIQLEQSIILLAIISYRPSQKRPLT